MIAIHSASEVMNLWRYTNLFIIIIIIIIAVTLYSLNGQRLYTVCLRLLSDSVAAAIWTQALLRLSPTR